MAIITRKCKACGDEMVISQRAKGRPQEYCSFQCPKREFTRSKASENVTREYQKSDRFKELQKIFKATPKNKKRQTEYNKTEKRKAANRKTEQTLKLKETRRQYRLTPARKTSLLKYTKTEKFRNQQHKYVTTEKGRRTSLAKSQRRRAIKQMVFVEDVDVRVLLGLQGGACFLCRQPITGEFKWPHPLSLSLDHITPLAKDGEHSYSNCAAAHLRCNIVKGTKSVDEVVPLLRIVS